MAKTVLVVDDDPTQRRLLQAVLERDGYAVVHAAGGGEAIDRMLRGGGADMLLLDMVMPEMSGLECLAELRSAGVTTPVIVLTANGGIDTVVKAMQAGAQDFFVKPVGPERLLVGVRNALKMTQLTAEVGRLTKRAQGRASFDDIIGDSAPMRMVKALGTRAAKSSIPVLITGESGVGKEVIARALHGASDRAGKPFVAVNCGALPANLAESILFGHEKGAFTGAVDKTLGKFREADGGTLFLDEIGELPLDLQVKLLRALQESEIDPVGGKRPVKIDVRIVSATNRDPAQQVKDGAFREDLFYRLNVFPIEAPSLRDRREDIPALVDHFIARFNAEEGKRIVACAPETQAMLQAFDWPGNVRQLENAVFRAIVLADSPFLQPYDFPSISGVVAPMPEATTALAQTAPSYADLPPLPEQPIRILDDRGHLRTLEDIERDLIQHAIEVYAGHMSEIARRLGIGRSTLYRKVREQGLEGQLKEAG
ncbi:MAG: sigma-54 dependent transcriptional regulator [Alphaproteobacteria bacterium]|uniref:sigma-54-dependent transcriptional regulator n=1 Tax=Brevundimonas sp. TaxID=1871086 RepID=UPI0008AB5667|nr:sigma-54 dependent transcriptional regulator [Alphaproteobacteria bacterium]OGN42922.1 MAG: sigma-54-dependent Fis family transcriptional regulator [Caulobacterales bacterium RIFCSPHIGHO2_01_FULL_67_30]MBU2029203.1 sigma-54 dependent transcriptional regulator [Alphaproteobacteria bacterium]MBU2165931.1 sigma-54 dependent transcriptional regulator [Alphaproteobacteria bacterium]MBU2232014.1 sigma-54 dependent transcriptional regulator [Alphaproteobacteria bacterium]